MMITYILVTATLLTGIHVVDPKLHRHLRQRYNGETVYQTMEKTQGEMSDNREHILASRNTDIRLTKDVPYVKHSVTFLSKAFETLYQTPNTLKKRVNINSLLLKSLGKYYHNIVKRSADTPLSATRVGYEALNMAVTSDVSVRSIHTESTQRLTSSSRSTPTSVATIDILVPADPTSSPAAHTLQDNNHTSVGGGDTRNTSSEYGANIQSVNNTSVVTHIENDNIISAITNVTTVQTVTHTTSETITSSSTITSTTSFTPLRTISHASINLTPSGLPSSDTNHYVDNQDGNSTSIDVDGVVTTSSVDAHVTEGITTRHVSSTTNLASSTQHSANFTTNTNGAHTSHRAMEYTRDTTNTTHTSHRAMEYTRDTTNTTPSFADSTTSYRTAGITSLRPVTDFTPITLAGDSSSESQTADNNAPLRYSATSTISDAKTETTGTQNIFSKSPSQLSSSTETVDAKTIDSRNLDFFHSTLSSTIPTDTASVNNTKTHTRGVTGLGVTNTEKSPDSGYVPTKPNTSTSSMATDSSIYENTTMSMTSKSVNGENILTGDGVTLTSSPGPTIVTHVSDSDTISNASLSDITMAQPTAVSDGLLSEETTNSPSLPDFTHSITIHTTTILPQSVYTPTSAEHTIRNEPATRRHDDDSTVTSELAPDEPGTHNQTPTGKTNSPTSNTVSTMSAGSTIYSTGIVTTTAISAVVTSAPPTGSPIISEATVRQTTVTSANTDGSTTLSTRELTEPHSDTTDETRHVPPPVSTSVHQPITNHTSISGSLRASTSYTSSSTVSEKNLNPEPTWSTSKHNPKSQTTTELSREDLTTTGPMTDTAIPHSEPFSTAEPADDGSSIPEEEPEPEAESEPVDGQHPDGRATEDEPEPEYTEEPAEPEMGNQPEKGLDPGDGDGEPESEYTEEPGHPETGNQPGEGLDPSNGDGEPEPDPEDTDDAAEPEGEADWEPETFAEPGPDWGVAKREWRQAWQFHVYFFGACFVLLGLYCLLSVMRLWHMEHLLSRRYFLTLNMLVVCVCLFRALYLLVDAYNSNGTFPIIMDYFVYSTVFPFITAAFSILFFALLLATRVRTMSSKVQKLWVLLTIIGFHFCLSIVTDVVVGLFATASVLLLICQLFFILWGLLMFVGYLVVFSRIYRASVPRDNSRTRRTSDRARNSPYDSSHQNVPKQRYTIGLAVKVTLVSAVFGLGYIGFELYGIFGVYGVLRTTRPDPWPWYVYHTIIRTLEIIMCSSVAYVAGQPFRYNHKKRDRKVIYVLPCKLLCCHDGGNGSVDGEFSTLSMEHFPASESDEWRWKLKRKRSRTTTPPAPFPPQTAETPSPYPPNTAERYADPDATLLVRKIQPSMLVVEDGFVRIRLDGEMAPVQHYDVDTNSKSSRTSVTMTGHARATRLGVSVNGQTVGVTEGVANQGYAQEGVPAWYNGNSNIAAGNYPGTDTSDTDTSGHIHSDIESLSGVSESNTADIFRPLSMIDLAASMESEIEKAFHSSFVDNTDLISHNSLPTSLEVQSSDSKEFMYNEELYEKYRDEELDPYAYLESPSYSSDCAENPVNQSNIGLLPTQMRRSYSADIDQHAKVKLFHNNRYFSLTDVERIGQPEHSPDEL